MLVLSRKLGEKIVIGDGIELMVVAVNGNRVKLGIAAPQNCRIVRSECRDKLAPERMVEVEVDEELLATC